MGIADDLPICECCTFWEQNHHPECPVRRRIVELETKNKRLRERIEELTAELADEVEENNIHRRLVVKHMNEIQRLRETLVDEVCNMVDPDCEEAYEALLKQLEIEPQVVTTTRKALEK